MSECRRCCVFVCGVVGVCLFKHLKLFWPIMYLFNCLVLIKWVAWNICIMTLCKNDTFSFTNIRITFLPQNSRINAIFVCVCMKCFLITLTGSGICVCFLIILTGSGICVCFRCVRSVVRDSFPSRPAKQNFVPP